MQAFPFAILAMVFYVAGGVCQGLALARRAPPHPILVRALGVLAVACHSVVAASALGDLGERSLGISASASLVSWLVAILLLLASLFKPVLSAAVALFPIAAATILLATELPTGSHRAELTPGIMIHILTSIAAFAVFAIVAVQAFLMARQNQALRHHHTRGLVQSLPPLTTMERVLFELIWVGMALLTAAIISGGVFLDDLFAQHLAHKTVLSLAAWVIFATLLAGRHFLGWRGNRAARWTLGGCALLLLAYFGSKFALDVVFDRV